jgi:hypothetical protein
VSNDHTTCFWAREWPGDSASVFAPGGAKPAAAGPDDNADGEAEDEDDALAVPSFGSSTSIAIAGAGGGWWNSADTVGGMHSGVGPGADDDIVPRFSGGSSGSKVPRLGSGGGGFRGRGGSRLMANAGGCQNGPSMSSATGMDGQGPHGGQQGNNWAYRQGGGDGVGRGGTGSGGGGGYDGPGRSAGFGGGGRGSQWNGPGGACRGGCY